MVYVGSKKTTHWKVERKTVEKNRRIHMKTLCFKLSSIIPKEHRTIHKTVLTQQDCFDEAASYILKLGENIEKLKQRKQMQSKRSVGQEVVEVRHEDLNLEVVVVSGVRKRFMFHELIKVLEDEGAEIVSASIVAVGDKIFHTIHSQAISSRIGLEPTIVSRRLKELVNGAEPEFHSGIEI
ncbi:transcription factor bHLH162-like [Curcuma longa]|uniref:transcription factor bHLH162-like n=1 Tax=Curcuma longa TaxID=136217 RepID=UPI003D9E8646